MQKHEELVSSLRATLGKLEIALGAVEDAIILTDTLGNIQWCNKAFDLMTGKSHIQILGANLPEMLPLHRENLSISLQEALLKPSVKKRLSGGKKIDSRDPVWLEIFLKTVTIHGMDTSVIFVLKDVTDKKKTEEMIIAKELAEKANQTKSEFLAKMSHELRTPLNSVIGFANILLKEKLGMKKEDKNYLERILDNGRHLLHLINSILDISKVEANRMETNLTPVDLDSLIRSTASEMEGQIQNEVKMTLEIPKKMASIRSDDEKLKQILINLIGNAIKFTAKGIIRVGVEADGYRPLRLYIADTGIGIPKEKLNSIFEPFSQVENSPSRRFGGSGLGLAIAKSFCRLLGYRLSVKSEIGKGSVFTVEF